MVHEPVRISRLSTLGLGPKDKYLALTKAHCDNVRANITYSRLDARGRGHVQLAAELPLLYTAGRWPTPPEVNYPAPADESAGQPRRIRQTELEPKPFLQSGYPVLFVSHDTDGNWQVLCGTTRESRSLQSDEE